MAYHLYQTEAFVLDERLFGEANKTYFLLTPELGLIRATAQGIRLLKSKLRYHLNLYSLAKIVLVRGKDSFRLVGAEKINTLDEALVQPEKLKAVSRVSKLLSQFIHGETEQSFLYEDLLEAFRFLVIVPSEKIQHWETVVVLRLLHGLGYIKTDSVVKNALDFKIWTETALRLAEENKLIFIEKINNAISVSHL